MSDRGRVLVVDDEELLREILCEELERAGFDVLEASEGNEALRLLDSHEVDVVLADVRMPQSNGIQLLARIRARHATWPAVILLSGYTGLSVVEAEKQGALALLKKPFELDEVVRVVREAIAKTPRPRRAG